MWCRTFCPWEEVRIDVGQTHKAKFVMGQHCFAFCTYLVHEEPLLYVVSVRLSVINLVDDVYKLIDFIN